jgi:FlgD Ig-like domain
MIRRLILLLAAAVLLPLTARAQAPSDLLAQGIRAYGVREFDGGAWLLRRALSSQGSDALSPGETARALMYLTAIEVARNQRDSALAAARRLLVIEPRYRPDDQTFPASVLAVLQEAKRSSPPTIAIRLRGDTAIRPGTDAVALRLTAPTPAEVTAAVTSPEGRVLRTLFTGQVRDSVDLRWNGLDVAGAAPPAGRYAISVTPVGRDRRAGWSLRLPIEVVRPAVDTTPLPDEPPDSLFRPERGDSRGAFNALLPGVLAGAAIVILPKVVASGENPTGARLVVGGAVTVAGIVAFLSHRPGQNLPGNSLYNRTLRENWKRNAADVARRNADQRRQARMIIRPGAPVLVMPEGQ